MTDDRKRLLVVDDEMEVCNFVKMFFEQRDFRVYQAQDGDEAVEVARDIRPHVVLLDIRMKGGEDGIEAVPLIREASPESQIIMTTGVDDESSIARAKSLGAVDYITKPLILEDLEANVLRRVDSPGD